MTWYDGGQLPPASVTGTEVPPANGTLILGELGKIFVPELGGRPLVIPKERGQKIEKPMLRPTPGHHQAWLEACKSGTPAPSDFDYASQLTATCLLGNVAIRCGHGIRWDAERRTTGQADADALLQREYRDW